MIVPRGFGGFCFGEERKRYPCFGGFPDCELNWTEEVFDKGLFEFGYRFSRGGMLCQVCARRHRLVCLVLFMRCVHMPVK